MIERAKERVGRLGRLIRRGPQTAEETPPIVGYIPSNYDLLMHEDPANAEFLTGEGFGELQQRLRQTPHFGKKVVDIGAAYDVSRGFIFLDARIATAVDPAYQWYEDRSKYGQYPHNVFGGSGQKELMLELLNRTLKGPVVPDSIDPQRTTLIHGERGNKARMVELVPEDAREWLARQEPQSVENYSVIRVFPSNDQWADLLISLKTGGVVLTTGYGRFSPGWGDGKTFEPDIASGGGIDVDNTFLPVDGQNERIGLKRLGGTRTYSFYQKTQHLQRDEIIQGLVR